jgi:hypothetical protein
MLRGRERRRRRPVGGPTGTPRGLPRAASQGVCAAVRAMARACRRDSRDVGLWRAAGLSVCHSSSVCNASIAASSPSLRSGSNRFCACHSRHSTKDPGSSGGNARATIAITSGVGRLLPEARRTRWLWLTGRSPGVATWRSRSSSARKLRPSRRRNSSRRSENGRGSVGIAKGSQRTADGPSDRRPEVAA